MATPDLIQPTTHLVTSNSPCHSGCSRTSTLKTPTKNEFLFKEPESTQNARIRSFSHWCHSQPSADSMISAGFFSCNISDRVICIYCNKICHEWSINDDPSEVHRRLSPQCLFVQSMSLEDRSPKILNNDLAVKLKPSHGSMTEPIRRHATYSHPEWTIESPSVEQFVRAGFFFAGMNNTVTCFFCNGSLHKWSPNDDPMIEHARWFPQCSYARDLCGNRLYERIQMSRKRTSEKQNQADNTELNRLVAARLDLPIVQQLRSRNQYSLAVIKRCIEDQLRIKKDDFVCDTDLTIACLILQKQIDHIKGSANNLVVPSKTRPQELQTEPTEPSLGECFICLVEEKQLACMPCGHLCACVSCGYALQKCPVCREKICNFIRINS